MTDRAFEGRERPQFHPQLKTGLCPTFNQTQVNPKPQTALSIYREALINIPTFL